jgi:ferredoxin
MKSKIRLAFQVALLGVVTWVAVAGLNVEKYCPLGGMLAFGAKLYRGTLACNMTEGAMFMGAVLALGALAIGKLFCAYLCPLGTVTEWLGKLGRKLKLQFNLPVVVDRILRAGKYFLIYIVAYKTVTESELFCKTFDPYYALATGFGHDSVFGWALAAVVLALVGSIVIKQFWCRYLCPLGAATNLLSNFYVVLAVFAVWIGLRLVGIAIPVVWLFGALAVLGYAWEVGFFKSFHFPLTKITVDQGKCTQCLSCDAACPHGIEVHKYQKVTHPDCMMCTECLHACPVPDTIQINHSSKLALLPPITVIVLVLAGFFGASQFEFKTLEERWGKFTELEKVEVYKQTGIKNVKCWGTAMALQRKLQDVTGIYGLDAYAGSHSVAVYYNPDEIDLTGVKKSIFEPSRYRMVPNRRMNIDTLSIWKFGVENLFDKLDNLNFFRAIHQDSAAFGFETNYGEPVTAVVFYDEANTNPENIRKLINETKKMITKNSKNTFEMDFSSPQPGSSLGKISRDDFLKRMFGSMSFEFNGYKNTDPAKLAIYEIGMPDAGNFMLRRAIQFMVSHLSADSAITRFQTSFTNREIALVYFDPAAIDTAKIHQMMVVDTLTYYKSDDTKGKKPNQFEFVYPSQVHPAKDFVDPVEKARERILE